MNGKFYGKYEGVVEDNKDPLMLGRIRAKVPNAMGDKVSGWARPCAPFGGSQMGFFSVPSEKSSVWIEFLHGDTECPIWTGCWWDTRAEIPSVLLERSPKDPPDKTMLVSAGGHSITLDDSPNGGITLETTGGQKIEMASSGITISFGKSRSDAKIVLKGDTVSINGDGLEVT